jgi:hypothetical protein
MITKVLTLALSVGAAVFLSRVLTIPRTAGIFIVVAIITWLVACVLLDRVMEQIEEWEKVRRRSAKKD